MSCEVVGPDAIASRARELVAARLPGYRVTSVRRLGSGEDHAAVEVNGELVVRFAGSGDAAAVAREAAPLEVVARVSPVAVPAPVFAAPEAGCLAYPRLAGTPLLHLGGGARPRHATAVGAALGELLAALRRVAHAEVADLVEVDDTAPAVWLEEAAELYAAVRAHVPAAHRPAVERFLASRAPSGAGERVLAHNDLGIEHVVVDAQSGRVTGVIDWSDAAIADPARDLALILRDLGPAASRAAAARLPGAGDGSRLDERVWFHARCGAIEDLAYGVRSGRREYATKSLDALGWLFASGASPGG